MSSPSSSSSSSSPDPSIPSIGSSGSTRRASSDSVDQTSRVDALAKLTFANSPVMRQALELGMSVPQQELTGPNPPKPVRRTRSGPVKAVSQLALNLWKSCQSSQQVLKHLSSNTHRSTTPSISSGKSLEQRETTISERDLSEIRQLIDTKVARGKSQEHIEKILSRIASSHLTEEEKWDLRLECMIKFSPEGYKKRCIDEADAALRKFYDDIEDSGLTKISIRSDEGMASFNKLLDKIAASTRATGLKEQFIKAELWKKLMDSLPDGAMKKIEKLIDREVIPERQESHVERILKEIALADLSDEVKTDLVDKCLNKFFPGLAELFQKIGVKGVAQLEAILNEIVVAGVKINDFEKAILREKVLEVKRKAYQALEESLDEIANSGVTLASINDSEESVKFEELLDKIAAHTKTTGIEKEVIKALLKEKILQLTSSRSRTETLTMRDFAIINSFAMMEIETLMNMKVPLDKAESHVQKILDKISSLPVSQQVKIDLVNKCYREFLPAKTFFIDDCEVKAYKALGESLGDIKDSKLTLASIKEPKGAYKFEELLDKIAAHTKTTGIEKEVIKALLKQQVVKMLAEARAYKALGESLGDIKDSKLTLASIKEPEGPYKFEKLLDEIVKRTNTTGIEREVVRALLKEKIAGAFYITVAQNKEGYLREELSIKDVERKVFRPFSLSPKVSSSSIKPISPFLSGFFDGDSQTAAPQGNDLEIAHKYFTSQNLLLEMYEKQALPKEYRLYVPQGSKPSDPVNFIAVKDDAVPPGYQEAKPSHIEEFKESYQKYQQYLKTTKE